MYPTNSLFVVTSPTEAPVEGASLIPTQGNPVDDTNTNSPTQMAIVDGSTTNSPTQDMSETTSNSPTQMTSVDETATSSPTQMSNTTNLASRSTVILNGFSISLTTDEDSLDDETLSAVMTQYLRDELEKLDGFVDVRLTSTKDETGQTGRQAQPYESRVFFGEAFFAGEAPEESVVLDVQDAALTDNTRVQQALNDGGVNADLIKTEIYEKETVGTEDDTTSGAQAVWHTFWFSFGVMIASLSAVV